MNETVLRTYRKGEVSLNGQTIGEIRVNGTLGETLTSQMLEHIFDLVNYECCGKKFDGLRFVPNNNAMGIAGSGLTINFNHHTYIALPVGWKVY